MCPVGHYCVGTVDQLLEDRPKKCPAGTYSDKLGLKAETECTHCDTGKYCEGGRNVTSGRLLSLSCMSLSDILCLSTIQLISN